MELLGAFTRAPNNPHPEPNQFQVLTPTYLRSILIVSSHHCQDLFEGLYHVDLHVKILKGLLPSSTLATLPANLIFLDLITLTILDK